MKHLLGQALKELKIEADEEKTENFLIYFEELLRWNKKINMVSRKLKKEEVLTKLLLPSLSSYKLVNKAEKILDFGAGGGVASIPLKIFKPKIRLYLLEAKRKPAAFLEHIGLLLKLDLNIINKFAQKKEDIDEQFDWIFVRAVNPEAIPKGASRKILYYGEYSGEKFTCKRKVSFSGNIFSVLI